MIPKILIKGEIKYKLIKIYKDFVLYENSKTGIKECFTAYQLGTLEEVIKPDKEADK